MQWLLAVLRAFGVGAHVLGGVRREGQQPQEEVIKVGLFGKKQEPVVREDQVRRLQKAIDEERGAAACEDEDNPTGRRDRERASAALDAAVRNSSRAEIERAWGVS